MSVIDDMLALQAQDEVIAELNRKIHDIPFRQKQESESLESCEQSIQEMETVLAEGEKNCRKAEADLEDLRAAKRKFEAQRSEMKSQTELNAMNRQIRDVERRIEDQEKRVEGGRAVIANASESIERHRAVCEEERVRIAPILDALLRQLAEAQKNLIAAQEKRAALRAALDVPESRRFLAYYERLGKKYPHVIVNISGATSCPGCHMALTASKIQEAVRNAALVAEPSKMKTVACDYCGRLLIP